MPRKSYAGAASATTLATAITSASASLSVANASGYPASSDPFVIVIGRGTSSEEKILIGTIASTTLTVATSGRGYDGTTAQAHASGDTVEHCIDAVTIDEANAHVNDDTRDDHSQYLNNTRHDVTARHTFGSAFAAPAAPPAIATSASAGTAGGPARSDHTHALGTGAINNAAMFTAGIAAIGGAITAPGTPAAVTTAAATGSATAPARGDHVHALAAPIAGSGIYLFGGALNVGVDGVTIQVNGSDLLEVIPASGTVPDGYVTTAKLADASVSTAKIIDGSVTAAKVASGIITSGHARLVPSGTTNVTGNTYTNWPPAGGGGPLAVTITKKLASSVLYVEVSGTGYPATLAGHGFFLAAIVAGTDRECARWFSNQSVSSPEHQHHGGAARVTGIAAGALTITARLKTDAAGGTTAWQTDANDSWCMVVHEVIE